uniref:Uncharacterized protein n=1 Tax=Cynoglossus semilaevis TaxID=244447 RepID=A0A3P8VB89_CYNSE
ITVTCIFTVPDLCGSPPSTAVKTNVCWLCSSRSKPVCSIISAYLLPSALVCGLRTKYLFALRE